MAAERARSTAAHTAAVPMAHGRAEDRTAESTPSGDWIERRINMPKTIENAVLFSTFMVYLRHGKESFFEYKQRGNGNHFPRGIRGVEGAKPVAS